MLLKTMHSQTFIEVSIYPDESDPVFESTELEAHEIDDTHIEDIAAEVCERTAVALGIELKDEPQLAKVVIQKVQYVEEYDAEGKFGMSDVLESVELARWLPKKENAQ